MATPLSPSDAETLIQRVQAEADAAPDFAWEIRLDLSTLLALVAHVQFALRHPQNTGPAAIVMRALIADLIARVEQEDYPATAELMRLGEPNPQREEHQT